jgi:hypothetical protein
LADPLDRDVTDIPAIMSGFGTKQTYEAELMLSALERIADIPWSNV